MKIETKFLGEIEFLKEDIIYFEEGLYGFTNMKEFILIINPEPDLPFHWLQSIVDEKLSFIVTSPFLFLDEYDFEVNDSIIEKLNIKTHEDIEIYSITVIPNEVKNTTINLKAPIIINKNNKKAKQLILNEDFPYKHSIFKKVNK
ncbi:flagellar assembly protein FliW [Helicovermis profundi]|uniref:Flagellar assembly factor FliW n=1 Tax=Helicovermis profundi TaxID=3065157 RepID=A0AAU9EDQ3_9FIRM|nr:flagellar assembly protein FliW [Clostridia bacterium S502]